MKRLVVATSLAIVFSACSPATTVAPPASSPSAAATPAPTPFAPADSAQLKWTVATGGSIWGSAAVRDGVVYIGSNDGSLYAVDTAGRLKWKFATRGEVRSTPAFTADAIVFSSDDGNVYALDASGKELWHTDIHSTHQRKALDDANANFDFDFLSSSPVAAGGRIFAGSADGSVYALDATTGAIAWTFKTGDRVRAAATVASGVVYIGSWDGFLYALNANSGALVWKYDASLGETGSYFLRPIQSTATVKDGVVYSASRQAIVFALEAATGKELWQHSNGNGNWYESSPVVSGNRVYIGSSLAGNLNSVDTTGGYTIGVYNFGTAAWSTPLVVGDVAFIGTEGFPGTIAPDNGGMWAVNLAQGLPVESRWSFKVTGSMEPAKINGVNSSPVLVDGTLYFGGLDGKIYALSV